MVDDLVASGHDVLNVDMVAPRQEVGRFQRADLTDLGEAIEVLRGAVRGAPCGHPGSRYPHVGATFEINTLSTYNVFSAATQVGLERVVWASSETVLGLPFGTRHARNLLDACSRPGHVAEPDYVPIDERHPRRPHSSYSLSKVVAEEMATEFARWSRIPFIGLRFSAIREPAEYDDFPSAGRPPRRRVERVGVRRCSGRRPGLPAEPHRRGIGAEVFIIAAADTSSARPDDELLTACFPSVPVRTRIGDHDTLLASARPARCLGTSRPTPGAIASGGVGSPLGSAKDSRAVKVLAAAATNLFVGSEDEPRQMVRSRVAEDGDGGEPAGVTIEGDGFGASRR